MTWQAGSFVVLAAVLLGGFAWYERSRPPSQVVALVAALAALAVAGRLAFAAIPNVVATTDIVLLTGYAIGAAPGFAVGALAGVVSNFWLGQGPWTPWQMAGWGLTGVLGAALAVASGRRLGRLPLACACAFAGIAYGALLNFSLMATYGGEQSLDRFAALSVRAIPFDLAHAGGNFALALAAGPAMVRMLVRFRERFEVRWEPVGRAVAAVVALAIAAAAVGRADAAPQPAQTAAPQPVADAAARGPAAARAWLSAAQNLDGGFGVDPSSPSDPLLTGWAALGLEAAGRNPLDLRRGGHSAIGYLRRHLDEARGTGDLERTILVVRGGGLDPRRFGGRNLVSALRARRRRDGSFAGQVNLTAFGILALRAARSRAGNARSAGWLRRAQNGDGGWGFVRTAPSDVDSTGAALQGIAAAGRRGRASRRGVAYLSRAQIRSGGFGLRDRSGANSQSTAWAVQGLIAAGRNPSRIRRAGRSPFDYLASRQARDGHYRYSSASDQTPVWVTGQALLAVKRRAFPLGAVPRAPRVAAAATGNAGTRGAVAAGTAPDGTARADRGNRAAASPTGAGAGTGAETGAAETAAASGGGSDPRVAADPAAETADAADRGGDFSSHGGYALGGLGGLAALLAGGWFVYRRRLV